MALSAGIQLAIEEKQAYLPFLSLVDPQSTGRISGLAAVELFSTSRLNKNQLNYIWQICNPQAKEYLTQAEFFKALRCIGKAQTGIPISGGSFMTEGPVAKLNPPSRPQVAAHEPPKSVSRRHDGHLANSQLPPSPSTLDPHTMEVSAIERTKFSDIFDQYSREAKLSGEVAKELFIKSKLSIEQLGSIWELSDSNSKGYLTRQDFVVAMFLISHLRDGSLSAIPATISSTLMESAAENPRERETTGTLRRHSTKPSGEDLLSFDSTPRPDEAHKKDRQDATNVSQSLPTQMSGSPVSAFPTASVKTAAPSKHPAISDDERRQFNGFFDQLDLERKGVLGGEELASFFLRSNLPESDLRAIWDLADVSKSGKLSRAEFAIAMHLIRNRRAGKELPTAISADLLSAASRDDAVNANLPGNRDSLGGLRSEEGSLRLQTTQLKEERLKLEGRQRDLSSTEQNELIVRVSQLRATRDAEKALLAELEKTLARTLSEIQTLRSQETEFLTEVSYLKSKKQELQLKVHDSQIERRSIEERIKETRKTVDHMRVAVKQMEVQSDEAIIAVENAKASLNSIESEGEVLRGSKPPVSAPPPNSIFTDAGVQSVFNVRSPFGSDNSPVVPAAAAGVPRASSSPFGMEAAANEKSSPLDSDIATQRTAPQVRSMSFSSGSNNEAIARPVITSPSSLNERSSSQPQDVPSGGSPENSSSRSELNKRLSASSSSHSSSTKKLARSTSAIDPKKPTLEQLAKAQLASIQKSTSSASLVLEKESQAVADEEPDFQSRFPDLDDLDNPPEDAVPTHPTQGDNSSLSEGDTQAPPAKSPKNGQPRPSLSGLELEREFGSVESAQNFAGSKEEKPPNSSPPNRKVLAAGTSQGDAQGNWKDPFTSHRGAPSSPVMDPFGLTPFGSTSPFDGFGDEQPKSREGQPFLPDFSSAFSNDLQDRKSVVVALRGPGSNANTEGGPSQQPTTAEDLEALFNAPSGTGTPSGQPRPQEHSSTLPTSVLGGQVTQEDSTSLGKQGPPPGEASTSLPVPSTGAPGFNSPVDERKVTNLIAMGFGREQAAESLRRYDGDEERALNFLLDSKELGESPRKK